jgi:multidrug resistance efflux pump
MLDGRQLRIELAGLQANLQSEKKKHDAALANRDISTAQIAMLNVKQLKSEIDWVQRKLENLEICAPIDGVVVAGDLQKSEGAPVQIGQNLFEIGPLDRMLVEIEIPESEIRYVREGQTAKVIFDAFPFEKFIGEIIRVHPQAELRDDNSVFVADVEIDNRNQKLRPGMKGRGRIRSSWQPLGWNLFHGSYESVRAWLVW